MTLKKVGSLPKRKGSWTHFLRVMETLGGENYVRKYAESGWRPLRSARIGPRFPHLPLPLATCPKLNFQSFKLCLAFSLVHVALRLSLFASYNGFSIKPLKVKTQKATEYF